MSAFVYGAHGSKRCALDTNRHEPCQVFPHFGYTGQYQDNESGLLYLRGRYYDPATQQFISRDPLEGSTNQPYAYAWGNPVNYTDPAGLWPGLEGGEQLPPEPLGTGTNPGGLPTRGGQFGYGNADRGLPDAGYYGGKTNDTLQPGEAGRFGDLDARRVTRDDLTPHHMPQVRQEFTSRDDGGALMLSTSEHQQTRTFGWRGRVVYKAEEKMLFRSVLARDLMEVQRLFGSKYNSGIRDLLNYHRENFPQLMNK